MEFISKNNEFGYDDKKLMSLYVDFKMAVALYVLINHVEHILEFEKKQLF